jgi:4-amino-4-deoxy-L-arabinose transferase-like glycosyltransferase
VSRRRRLRENRAAQPAAPSSGAAWHKAALPVLGLVVVFVLLSILSLRQEGATFDEAVHIAAGYSYWRTGDFRMMPEHPPLAKLLAALPLLGLRVSFSESWPEWQQVGLWELGNRFVFGENDAETLLFWARLPNVLLGACLCLLIAAWAYELAGATAAILAAALAVFLPDFLAHARLVTTDIPVTTFVFAHVYLLWRMFRQPTRRNVLLSALALALALATKFSALLFLPISAALFLWRGMKEPRERRLIVLRHAALHAVVALAVLWICYGFAAREPQKPAALPRFQPTSLAQRALAFSAHALTPGPYAFGLIDQMRLMDKCPAFVDGARSDRGFWYYFVFTFLYKTPLPFILLLALALAWWAGKTVAVRGAYLFVLLPPLLYFAVALTVSLNIGHRHILPVFPFLIVFIASIASAWTQPLARGAVILLLAWQAGGTLLVHPRYLTFFNEVAGGPANGWKHLVDSNLDWGQDLPGLKRWMDAHQVSKIWLSYFGTAPPEHYGIDYEPLPSVMPLARGKPSRPMRAGDYVAISATNLQSVYASEMPPAFDAFVRTLREKQQPIGIVGHTIFIYRVPER